MLVSIRVKEGGLLLGCLWKCVSFYKYSLCDWEMMMMLMLAVGTLSCCLLWPNAINLLLSSLCPRKWILDLGGWALFWMKRNNVTLLLSLIDSVLKWVCAAHVSWPGRDLSRLETLDEIADGNDTSTYVNSLSLERYLTLDGNRRRRNAGACEWWGIAWLERMIIIMPGCVPGSPSVLTPREMAASGLRFAACPNCVLNDEEWRLKTPLDFWYTMITPAKEGERVGIK